MFVGSYPLRLDEKGRLALPVRFRDQVADGMVIKKGQERCIYGLTMSRVAEQSAAMAAMIVVVTNLVMAQREAAARLHLPCRLHREKLCDP